MRAPEQAVPGVPAAGTVHFFQAYTADYAGAPNVEALIAAPLQYDRLAVPPLPLSPTESAAAQRGRSGGRGNGTGRSKGRRASGFGFGGRYFDASPAAATPGLLSAELRAILGMRDGDPPPYLPRMQQLGYPPGYLGDPDAVLPEDEPLVLHESQAPDGEAVNRAQNGATRRSKVAVPTVDFPGLNVPPPPGADLVAWGWQRERQHERQRY